MLTLRNIVMLLDNDTRYLKHKPRSSATYKAGYIATW